MDFYLNFIDRLVFLNIKRTFEIFKLHLNHFVLGQQRVKSSCVKAKKVLNNFF